MEISGKLYWASADVETVVRECENRRKFYYRYLNDVGFMFLWNAVYRAFYAATEQGPFTLNRYQEDNIVDANINDFRNLIMHKVGIIISQNPTFEPMSVNTDVKSIAQCKLAKSLLNYYTDVKRGKAKVQNIVLNAALFGEGFMLQTWDATAGSRKFTLPVEGGTRQLSEGDVDQRVFEPVDIIRDIQIMDVEQNHWYIVREVKNRYDTAAKYPELYNEILNANFERPMDEHYLNYNNWNDTKDLVVTYTLYHKRTAACPNGRIVKFINQNIILSDGDLPMQDYPLHRISDTDIKGKNFAYTDAFDMLGLQDLCNGLASTVVTNLNAFGVQNIIVPFGSNVSETQYGGKLNIIEWDPQSGGVPQALQLTAQPDGVWNALNYLNTKLEIVSGVNSTARGNPPPQVGSGVALSMMQSLNIQYAQGLQTSYVTFMETSATALINLLKDYAQLPRIAQITGEANSSYLKEFKGSDLLNVNRVVAKLSNPMTNTVQGRYTIGEMLASKGLIKDASDLLTVLETGNLDTLTDGRNMQLYFCRTIVEKLRNGEDIPLPAITDDHLLHIRHLADLAADVDIRMNRPDLLVRINDQILAHMKFLQDPSVSMLMVALQQQPLPVNQPAQSAQAPQGAGGGANIQMNTSAPVNIQGSNQNAAAQAAISQGKPMPPVIEQPGTPTGQLPADFAQFNGE